MAAQISPQLQAQETPQGSSSRVFIRGLPPTISESEFQSHFSKRSPVTDVKLFPTRRIGYVGYRTPQAAQDAIEYFNKSYVRTSKVTVEAAVRPGKNIAVGHRDSDAIRGKRGERLQRDQDLSNPLKRKRDQPGNVQERTKNEQEIEKDPKFKEWLGLMIHPSRAQMIDGPSHGNTTSTAETRKKKTDEKKVDTGTHGEEPPKENKKARRTNRAEDLEKAQPGLLDQAKKGNEPAETETASAINTTDDDWMRSRTSRLLGVLNDDEEEEQNALRSAHQTDVEPRESIQQPTPPPEETVQTGVLADMSNSQEEKAMQDEEASIRETGRLFLRNLSYAVTDADLEEAFSTFGSLDEVHVATDPKTGVSKGLAFVQFDNTDDAVKAYEGLDGEPFQGRLLHILPANKKRESKPDEFAISQLPLKKQKQIQKRTQALTSSFNWNSLYMNTDAVMSSISDRLGVAKSELFDPSSSDAAVKQAQAETHVIQETKAYFESNGVDLDAFKSRERDDCSILVKNFTYGVRAEELKKLFEDFGEVQKVLMPPGGTIAIVQFAVKTHAHAAFKALAYRKHKDSVLFLEKAPKGVLNGARPTDNRQQGAVQGSNVEKPSTSDIMQSDSNPDSMDTSTLFIRNLDFRTTNDRLLTTFKPLDGLRSVRIKTKPDAKNPGQTLSMGFGFAEFDSKEHALSALIAMNGYSLDGHELVVKASHKGLDAADERRREDRAKRVRERKSKIIIKNLPFEATNKDVRNLFRTYGQLRAVRLPKKFDNSRKGFAFAEFTTPKEAENAMAALQNTHLLGRRLVLDYAAGEADNPEEELQKMQDKISKQTSRVALQNLTTSQRKKFEVGSSGAGDEGAT